MQIGYRSYLRIEWNEAIESVRWVLRPRTSLSNPAAMTLVWAAMTLVRAAMTFHLDFSNCSSCFCPWLLAVCSQYSSPNDSSKLCQSYHLAAQRPLVYYVTPHKNISSIRISEFYVLGHYCIPSFWKNAWHIITVSSYLFKWMNSGNNLSQR